MAWPPAAFSSQPQLAKFSVSMLTVDDGGSWSDDDISPNYRHQYRFADNGRQNYPILSKDSFDTESTDDESPLITQLSSDSLSSSCPRRSSVSFNLDSVTHHAVTAYSEVYGRHPREFVFLRDFDNEIVMAAPDATMDDDDDEDFAIFAIPPGCIPKGRHSD